MVSLEELLEPIHGDNPSGEDLRYNAADNVHDKIREARRQDDDLAQGAWQRERKTADYLLAAKLAAGALRNKSKDLQLAVWLTDAKLRTEGFAGLQFGLSLCRNLLEIFWDTIYPLLEEGDSELRSTRLSWLAEQVDDPLRSSPLTKDGYGWYVYKESRANEEPAKEANSKKAPEKLLTPGKVTLKQFDHSFSETPKAFYLRLEATLDSSLLELAALDKLCQTRFGHNAPFFGKSRTAMEEIRQVAHGLLQKKRETDPDSVVEEQIAPGPAVRDAEAAGTGEEGAVNAGVSIVFQTIGSSESPMRRELVLAIATAAATLRRKEPFNPAGYMIMRGLRWGDLRNAAALSDSAMLEAPPTEVRQQIKRLAMQEKWQELLESAEAIMALPCSRAWLDLQRFVVEACTALGSDYSGVAVAIRSELRALLRDVPQLSNSTLMDDTPAANLETRQWLRQLLAEPAIPNGDSLVEAEPSPEDDNPVRWQKRMVDRYVLAKEALRTGKVENALEIMQNEIACQRSARGRFQRRVQFVELCVAAGKELIAQPILEDLITAIDAHKLEEWEDKSSMAAALVTIMRASKRIQADAKEKQKFFERVCRLDPVQALNC